MPTITQIGQGAIGSLSLLPSIADQRILGNVSGASATPSALTAAQTATFLAGVTIQFGAGTAAAPSVAIGQSDAGFYRVSADEVWGVVSGSTHVLHFGGNNVGINSNLPFSFAAEGADDLQLKYLATGSLRQGKAPSATPVAQTFTIGEASRPGTDTNVGGASGTLRPGLGTGTGTASSLTLQGVVVTGSGSGVQSYQDMVKISGVSLGFYNTTPVAQQTGVAVTAAGIHAALVNLGLITS